MKTKKKLVKVVKAKVVKAPPIVPETGDKCEYCGRLTDTILFVRGQYVCECCEENAENDWQDRKAQEKFDDSEPW